jgi:hypothetical protein
MPKNAVEQVGAPGRKKIVLQINPTGNNVCNIKESGVSSVLPTNIRNNTVRVILIM